MAHASPLPPTRRWPGFFVVIEGIDGTGKSTLARGLAAKLEERGTACLLTREPTDGPFGKKIRELAVKGRDSVTREEELELFIADRKEHLQNEVLPALAAGKTVIMDRYFYSTIAYQGALGLDPAEIARRHRDFAPEPDLLILLELPIDEAIRRIEVSRGSGRDHFEGKEYLRRVAELFATIEHPRMLRMDARLSPEALVEKATPQIISG